MKRLLIFALLLSLLGASPALAADEIPAAYTSKTKVASGYFATVSSLCLFDDFTDPANVAKYNETWAEIKALLETIEQTVSVSIPTSDIARFNALPQGGSMAIAPLTAELLLLAQDMYRRTDGFYDPTVYPLVDLWGFSPRFTYSSAAVEPYDRERSDETLPPPDPAYIEGFLQLVGMDGIQLSGDAQSGYTLTKQTPSVTIHGVTYPARIDLGGIAKGYAVDLARDLLLSKGYEYGYFSCGSSSIYVLKSASKKAKAAQDDAFYLEVRSPRDTATGNGNYARVAVRDSSLSSSGDYGHHYVLDSQRYCHIIDPRTGYPMNVAPGGAQQGVCTATLLSQSATEDDAFTTALCLMGPEGALNYLNTRAQGQDILLVYYREGVDRYEVVTNLPPERLTLIDPAYVLCSRRNENGLIEYTGQLFAP